MGASLPWDALIAFIRRLPATSETRAEVDPDAAQAAWWAANAPAYVLADLYELTAAVNRRRGRRPVRYPRPGDSKDAKTYGSDPVPMSEFERWWEDSGEQD